MSFIPRWRPVTKRTLDLFGRWGDSRSQLKSMLDVAVPVVVVDRFRDDDEGSVYGIRASGGSSNFDVPSVSFGSGVNDWELLAVTQLGYSSATLPVTVGVHMFTPIFPYNPALVVDPVGFFLPGLITNRAFTFGTVSALGGNNPARPFVTGPQLMPFVFGSTNLDSFPAFSFDPPIRVYRDTTLTFQWTGAPQPTGLAVLVSILYRERPKVSAS